MSAATAAAPAATTVLLRQQIRVVRRRFHCRLVSWFRLILQLHRRHLRQAVPAAAAVAAAAAFNNFQHPTRNDCGRLYAVARPRSLSAISPLQPIYKQRTTTTTTTPTPTKPVYFDIFVVVFLSLATPHD